MHLYFTMILKENIYIHGGVLWENIYISYIHICVNIWVLWEMCTQVGDK